MTGNRHINALVFARYSSSRLPGKVLMEIDGTTIIGLCVKKLRQLPWLRVIVATSTSDSDKAIVEWCKGNDVLCYTGDLNNVAQRAADCITQYPCKAFFRVNADSPFLQTDIYETALKIFEHEEKIDLVSNVQKRSYPYGVAVELINSNIFLSAVNEFSPVEQEHITKHFYDRADKYHIENIGYPEDLSGVRLVLDTREDWEEITELYTRNKNIFNLTLNELVNIKSK